MGIVIGTQEKIDSIFKQLDPDYIYEKKNSRNLEILTSKLNFDCKQITTFCIRIDRCHILDNIAYNRRIKQKNIVRKTLSYI